MWLYATYSQKENEGVDEDSPFLDVLALKLYEGKGTKYKYVRKRLCIHDVAVRYSGWSG